MEERCSAISIIAFRTGSPAFKVGTVGAGGDANILTISSAACMSWSFRVTLGNATSWGKNVTVSHTLVVLVRGKYARCFGQTESEKAEINTAS